MPKPLEEWTVEELRAQSARILEELARRAVTSVRVPKADVVRSCERWVHGHAWDETFTAEMVEDEFGVHERKLGQVLPGPERKRLLELWLGLRDERARHAA
ncbi:MAG: hypothetical protein ACYDCH_07525 [Gaiellaceae bacterium]